MVRSQVLSADPLNPGGTGDDENGWKLRVGNDNNANPNNPPPANYDNPDGVAGTNDELVIGMAQVSFQQNSGAVACQTFYQYTTPGQASVTFNNFDMDGNTRLRYYAPGDPAYNATATSGGTVGTMSGDAIWNNGGTLAARVGDTIASPTTGWWRMVNCVNNGSQLIQEGQPGVLSYYTQPPTPNMTLTKSDGVATAAPGQALTYTITATNNAPAAGGGAANNVVVADTIPAGFTYTGCSIPTPTQGTWTCSQAAGVVTFTQTGWINRGAAAVLRVTGTVNQGVTGSITNTARINYTDGLGNAFPQVTATDVDTITASSNLSITKTDSTDPENPGQSFVYTLTANNAGPSDATNVVVSDTVPSQYTVTGVTSPSGMCGNVGNAVTCTRPAFPSGAAAWVITVNVTVNAATPGGTYANTATVSATEADPTPANNTVNQNNTVRNTADLAVTKTDGIATVNVGGSTTYTITLTNNGPTVVPAGVIVSDTIPVNTVGSEAEADCAITAGVFRCMTTAPLAVGAVNSYQLTLTLSAGFATRDAGEHRLHHHAPGDVHRSGGREQHRDRHRRGPAGEPVDHQDRLHRSRESRCVLQLHADGEQRRSVDRDQPHRVRHRPVAVHREQRDLSDGQLRERGQRRHLHPRLDGVRGAGVGDHGQRHREAHDPGRHVREHGDRERVLAERSYPGEQHREQQQHGESHR